MSTSQPFITVDHITVRLPNRLILEDSFWKIRSDEHWAILGPNGSGKTTLVRSLWGGVPLRSGSIHFDFLGPHSNSQDIPPREVIGVVSLEMHQRLMEQEEIREEFRAYAGENGEGTAVEEVIFSGILAQRELTPRMRIGFQRSLNSWISGISFPGRFPPYPPGKSERSSSPGH